MRRAWVGVGVLLTIACGLGVRRIGGAFGEHAGNVAWGVMSTLIVLGVVPRARVWVVAGAAVAIVFGIEFLQLTPYPAQWSAESVIGRYTLGGVFEWHDLVGGAVGVGWAAMGVAQVRRRQTRGPD